MGEPTSEGITASLKRGICLIPGVCRTGGTGLSEKSSVFANPAGADWKQSSLSAADPCMLAVMSGVHGKQNASAKKKKKKIHPGPGFLFLSLNYKLP